MGGWPLSPTILVIWLFSPTYPSKGISYGLNFYAIIRIFRGALGWVGVFRVFSKGLVVKRSITRSFISEVLVESGRGHIVRVVEYGWLVNLLRTLVCSAWFLFGVYYL